MKVKEMRGEEKDRVREGKHMGENRKEASKRANKIDDIQKKVRCKLDTEL